MKFTCQKSTLYEVLPNIAKAASSKTPMEVLSAIRLRTTGQELELTGYDMELGIRTSIPASVEEEDTLLIDSRMFSEIVRTMPEGQLEIQTDANDKFTIRGGETECQVAGMKAEEYPDLPDIEEEKGTVIPQRLLKDMINQTIYAVSQDETKPIFTGELLEIENDAFNMVAMDSFRMAFRTEKLAGQNPVSFVVPSKALREIEHLLSDEDTEEKPCMIRMDQHHAIFEIDRYCVYTRLLAGQFINYRRSIPENPKTEILISRKDLMESLQRCTLYITDKTRTPVQFQFEDNRLRIRCQNILGSIDDQISCEMSGEKLYIGFNNRYLLDSVRVIQGDRVRMHFTGPDRAAKIMEEDGENSIALVMPVQLKR